MKTILCRILLCLSVLASFKTRSETYSDLHSFTPIMGYPSTNYDGAEPYGALVLTNGVLYGTAWEGGTNGAGSIFSVHTDGTQFKDLHSFAALSGGVFGNNSDGGSPYDTLVLSSNNQLFGTAYSGGTGAGGAIFRINTDGSGFTNIFSFPGTYQGAPRSQLFLSNNVLFGTTTTGGSGSSTYGSVFRINTDGSHFTNLIGFYPGASNEAYAPFGGVILADGKLYGTTAGSSAGIGGSVFSIGADGRGYTNLFYFQSFGGENLSSTNTTGGKPSASLTLVGDTLFGTTPEGGTNGNGVIFSINTNGTAFKVLHMFQMTATYGPATNSDGANPLCQLLAIGNTLYGTAPGGGVNGYGTIFSINTDGSDFTVVYSYPVLQGADYLDLDGASPAGGLIVSGTTLYGTSTSGGGEATGNVYSYDLSPVIPPPVLTVISSSFVVLSWDASIYSLQASTDLSAGFSTVSASSPYYSIGAGSQQFFRLKHK